jgi:pimeloyl-ACP methyl ester carboxylesterase
VEPANRYLSARFRIIAPDMRGFGKSQPPTQWTMEDMADDLNDLLDDLNVPSVALVGVSIGGYIGLTFWSKYPNRIRQLVLSNSRARADNETEKASRNEMIALVQQHGSSILPDRMLPRLLQPNPNPEAVRYVRSTIERASPSAAAYALMAMRDRMDFSSLVHRMSCPTLIIAGENDAIIPADESRSVAESIPEGRFACIANSGHLSNIENPTAYNDALLSFLDSK